MGRLCKTRHIEHRLTRPRTPRTDGLVEPFNRRLNEAIARKTRRQDNHGKRRFHAHQDRNRFITRFARNSNRARLQRLNYQAPKLSLDKHAEQRTPVVPPKSSRRNPWQYKKQIYKRGNEIERLFRRLKGFRRIFSRFEKLDIMFKAFINFARIIDMMSVNTR